MPSRPTAPGLDRARKRMIIDHLMGRDIRDPRVVDAMASVPRELFVPTNVKDLAYADSPLGIGEGQTISQPYIVALMAEAAALHPSDTVLEIGTGSGYAAAVFSRLAKTVHTIERHRSLAERASRTCTEAGYTNVHVHVGDGSLGLPDEAPFDAILVAAGGPRVPETLREQLAVGGRLVIPVGGSQRHQRLVRVTRKAPSEFVETDLGAVAFVPLVGAGGWPSNA